MQFVIKQLRFEQRKKNREKKTKIIKQIRKNKDRYIDR